MSNSRMFYDFMISNGFYPNGYENILELNQSVDNSISKYINQHNQYLLSDQVEYDELEKKDIKGARGYIDLYEGIVVPKSLAADDYFFGVKEKSLYTRHSYRYPNISEFDTIVSYNDLTDNNHIEMDDLKTTLYHCLKKKDYLTGFMIDRYSDKTKQVLAIYEMMMDAISVVSGEEYKIAHDTCIDKDFYLVKKK